MTDRKRDYLSLLESYASEDNSTTFHYESGRSVKETQWLRRCVTNQKKLGGVGFGDLYLRKVPTLSFHCFQGQEFEKKKESHPRKKEPNVAGEKTERAPLGGSKKARPRWGDKSESQ